MLFAEDLRRGQIVRLTMPYRDAERGIYTVVYVYRNGWLGVVSHSDGRRYDVPGQVCRQVETAKARVNKKGVASLQHAERKPRGLQQQRHTQIGEESGAGQIDPAEETLVEKAAPKFHDRREEETPANLRHHETAEEDQNMNRLRIKKT